MGIIYPLFFLGSVIIAVILFYVRTKSGQGKEGPGLVTHQDVSTPIEQVPNITQRLNQQAAGSYDPSGSTATAASYSGMI